MRDTKGDHVPRLSRNSNHIRRSLLAFFVRKRGRIYGAPAPCVAQITFSDKEIWPLFFNYDRKLNLCCDLALNKRRDFEVEHFHKNILEYFTKLQSISRRNVKKFRPIIWLIYGGIFSWLNISEMLPNKTTWDIDVCNPNGINSPKGKVGSWKGWLVRMLLVVMS